MKVLFTIAFCLFFMNIFAQKVEDCALDNNPKITKIESQFLNKYFESEGYVDAYGTRHIAKFDFSDKKIIFVTNSTGSRIITKKAYFDQIKGRDIRNDKIVTDIFLLSEQERIKSGGYDAFVTSYIKVFPKSSRKKVIKDAPKTLL